MDMRDKVAVRIVYHDHIEWALYIAVPVIVGWFVWVAVNI